MVLRHGISDCFSNAYNRNDNIANCAFVGGTAGKYINGVANAAKTLTGAGIGVGVAVKFGAGPLVTVSVAVWRR